MPLSENKDLKLYYSISEVAKMFNVSETLLRFWEKQFPQIKPEKRYWISDSWNAEKYKALILK